jgi:signal transduction histidine kinase
MSSETSENRQSAALRRSEAYLAETQRLTRTGSFAIEVATQAVTYSSAEHVRLYGFDPAHGLPSIADFFARIHPDDRAMCMEVMSKGIREVTDVEVEYRVLMPGGPPRIIHAFGHPVPGASGESVEIVGTIVDVTERHEAEAQAARVAEEQAARGEEFRVLAEEQAALRRVATLVARGVAPEEVFAAVTDEVERLLGIETAAMIRFESDGTRTVVAISGRLTHLFPVGQRVELGGRNVSTLVFETGRPARLNSYADASGSLGVTLRENGMREAVGAPIIVEGRLWGAMNAGSVTEYPLPADTETRLVSFTELVATAVANAESRAALAASRARIVAAADESRRQIQRDLHDGAQQRLVTAVVGLKLASQALSHGAANATELVAEALRHAEEANAELRELAHGILPSALTSAGLRGGLDALVSRIPLPVTAHVSVERLPASVEATAYFIVSEALTNVLKHAHANQAMVTVHAEDRRLQVEICDDGIGGADPQQGSGLIGLSDRVEALGGTLQLTSPTGRGTTLLIHLPVEEATSNRPAQR